MLTAIWNSRAELAIVQAQDILGLGSEARHEHPVHRRRKLALEGEGGKLYARAGCRASREDGSLRKAGKIKKHGWKKTDMAKAMSCFLSNYLQKIEKLQLSIK